MWQIDGVDVESARREIAAHREIHDQYVEKIEQLTRKHHYEDAAQLAQMMGMFAWYVHAGKYCCPRTERSLNSIGRDLGNGALSGDDIPPLREPLSKRRVLHVMSVSYHTGGHTKAVARMISNTLEQSIGSVVITNCSGKIPEWLEDKVRESGGWLKSLDSNGSLLDRARTLRSLTRKWADLVILHIHPNDPIANLAYSRGMDVPIVFFNHADHVFWYGSSVVDTVAQIRPAGKVLSDARRGVHRSIFLPIPLEEIKGKDSLEAKTGLGLKDDIVLFSVASPYKYKKIGTEGFLEIHERILRKYDNVKLLVVGPEDAGEWREFHDRTDSRITALGIQRDLSKYYACADIYVDSYPFASLTSLLDCCLQGKPAVGLYNTLSPVLSCDDISLNRSGISQPTTPEGYEHRLSRLIEDAELRRVSGQTLKRDILQDHAGAGWLAYWEELVNAGKAAKPSSRAVADQTTYDDILIYMQRSVLNYWGKFNADIPYLLRRSGLDLKTSLAVDCILKRNFFCKSSVPPKYFISQRTVSGLKGLLPAKK